MGRSQSAQISKESEANSQADEARAGAAYNSTVNSLNKYSNNLDNFLKFGRSTYGANGEFARDQNTIATGAAEAGANKVGTDMATNAMRTGANTANYAPALATSQRQASQDLTQNLANADASRLQQLTNVNQFGVTASGLPASVYGSLYGTGTSGSNAAMGTAASASAASPGFMDEFGKDLSSGIGAAAGAAGAVL